MKSAAPEIIPPWLMGHVAADGRALSLHEPTCLSAVVDYHGLAHRHLPALRLLMRPQLNGGTLGGRQLGHHEAQ
jgi:hypothetical protein